MKKAADTTQKKTTTNDSTKGQKNQSFASKTIAANPVKSSTDSVEKRFPNDPQSRSVNSFRTDQSEEGSSNKRKVTEITPANASQTQTHKLRRLSLKKEPLKYKELNVTKLHNADEDVLSFLEEEGELDTKASKNDTGIETGKKKSVSDVKDAKNKVILDPGCTESDLDVSEFFNDENDYTEKKNVRSSKAAAVKVELEMLGEKSLSFGESKFEAKGKDGSKQDKSEYKQSNNASKKGLSPLKTESQNIKTSVEEEIDILSQLLAEDAEFLSEGNIFKGKSQDDKKKIPHNVFKENKLNNCDEKLLNNLLVENNSKLKKETEDSRVSKKSQINENRSKQCEGNDATGKVKEFIDAFSEEFGFEDEWNISKEKTSEVNSKTDELQRSESNYEFDDFFADDWDGECKEEADLKTLQRCEVVSICKDKKHNLIVNVKHAETNATAIVTFTGLWLETKLEPGDFVNIEAVKGPNGWTVDNNNGFVVSHPDTLVSGTSIVGGLFCPRRGVLKERFKEINPTGECKQDGSFMTIGILVHELLQEILIKKIYKMLEMSKLLEDMMKSKHTRDMVYWAGMSMEDCKKEMSSFVPKVYEFVERYVKGKKPKSLDDNFKGQIHTVHDIEENMWIPKLGIKGKIDATVEVNVNTFRRIMPLELKTGKASFSMEHKGQVILYTMMMTQAGEKVDTGLLLYLRENMMREVKVGHKEQRDLILFRNNLAYYLTRQPKIQKETDSALDTEEQLELMELPEPINHRSCGNCSYKSLCCTYLSKDESIQLSESHPLTKISKEFLSCIKQEHIDYVTKWVTLLQVEEVAQNDFAALKDIWTVTPMQREKRGKNISNLKVSGTVEEECGRFLHTFVRANKDDLHIIDDFNDSKFNSKEYVIVSTNTRINISAGSVIDISEDSITLLLDRDITRRNPNAVFHIDTYSSQSLLTVNLSNIGYLLENSPISEKLRNIVIDRKPSTFVAKLSRQIAVDGAEILHPLNKIQQRAVLNVLRANEFLLIKGMPGTGKTQTLIALVELLIKIGKSVLITAHTHTAVDNVLLRLNERGVDFLRLGSSSKVHPMLKHKCENSLTEHCETPESLDAVYNSKNVVGVTCLGANHPLLDRRAFDVCLVDESTQVLQSSILRPLYSAKKFVLIGDPDQLPPIVKNNRARELGMDESLFARLDNENNTVVLSLQYRMNSRVMKVANDLTYKGLLNTGSDAVANATLNIPDKSLLDSCEQWIKTTLSQELDDSVVILNTGATYNLNFGDDSERNENNEDRRCSNLYEAAIIFRLTTCLLNAGVPAEDIGVIAPYRAQVGLLKKKVQKGIEVNTVDQYQGRAKDVILYSCAKSIHPENAQEREFEILEDQRRLTVAITRSKHKLIIVGDRNTLELYTPLRSLLGSMRDKDIVNLKQGCENFSWQKLLAEVR